VNLADFVFDAARRLDRWSHPAVVCGDRRLTYADLLSSVRRFAGALRGLGVGRGDRVAIVARDCPEFVVAFLGTAAAGAVSVPTSTMLSPAELEYVLAHCGARAAVFTSDQAEKLRGIRASLPGLEAVLLVDGDMDGAVRFAEALGGATEAEIEPVDGDAPALILYTSGSTGRPKGAMHVHRSLPATVEGYCRHVLRVAPEDRLFSSSRLFFAYGLGNSLSFPLSSGAAAVLCEERPTPTAIAGVFERHRPSIFFAVPSVYNALLAASARGESFDAGSLRICISAGEKLPERTFHEWRRLTGLEILDGIGSTEMLHDFMSNTHDDVRPGSSGREVPGYEAKLVDPFGEEISGAGVGNLMVKGPSASPGYWANPDKTAETMVGGWVRTGDVYRRDAEGYYWFEGRSDDLFKVKGMWVSPVEVEEALLACAGVSEAAVVPAAADDGTTVGIAYVVLGPAAPADPVASARSRLEELLPPYKCPAEIRVVSELPRTATGKLQRYKLR
jgi:4-hydroxybenzoate-CoA ligase